MVDYGKVRSTEKPESIVIDDYSVWKNTDINEICFTDSESGIEKVEYEFHMIRYSKNEFILAQAQENSDLSEQITDTQLALCELYESMI